MTDPFGYPAENYQDYRFDVYSNSAMSATVVTHLPSGMRESCDDKVSPFQQRRTAVERLLKRIAERAAGLGG